MTNQKTTQKEHTMSGTVEEQINKVLEDICGCREWGLNEEESKREHDKAIKKIMKIFSLLKERN